MELQAAEALAEELRPHYLDVRVLPDRSVAILMNLLFTRAIGLGCHRGGFERRFCFADRELASKRFTELQSEDDTPEGFVARRPA